MASRDGYDEDATPPEEGDTAVLPGATADVDAADPYDEANAPHRALVAAPAEPLPDVAIAPAKPPVLRRKRRDLDRRRQRALLDLGGLVVEMARRERMRVDLLKHRAAIVLAFDAEIDAIDEALESRRPR